MIALSLILLATSTQPTALQVVAEGSGCEFCKEDYVGGVQSHKFPDPTSEYHMFSCDGTDGGLCHGGWIEFFCDVNHNPCGIQTRVLAEAVEHAIDARNAHALAVLLAADRAVEIDGRNRTVQVRGCKGEVAFKFNVDAQLVQRLATTDR